MTRVAINGFGRIGRAAFKILQDTPDLDLVAVNDIVPIDNLAYLLKYDTVYGRYDRRVEVEGSTLVVGGRSCKVYAERDPVELPWRDLGVEIVFECTGLFVDAAGLRKHLQAGAQVAILSAPAKGNDIPTVVYGVNSVNGDERIISCASCTTNCITPVVEVMERRLGVEKAMLTTIHAYTASQKLVDGPSRKLRRGRAGAANLVPTTTGAAIATTRVLPALEERFDGVAVRAPVPAGSIADIVFVTRRPTTVEEVNAIFREEAASEQYREVLAASEEPIVSSDIVGDTHASIIDLEMTQVVDGNLVKVMSWYDNEWGFTSQMVREGQKIARALPQKQYA